MMTRQNHHKPLGWQDCKICVHSIFTKKSHKILLNSSLKCKDDKVAQWQRACPRTEKSAVQVTTTASCCVGELFTYIQLLLLISIMLLRPVKQAANSQEKQHATKQTKRHILYILYLIRDRINGCYSLLISQTHKLLEIKTIEYIN